MSASTFTYTDGSASSPLTESTNYTYQVSAFSGGGESGPSNASSATTKTEPAPTKLGSYTTTRRTMSGCYYIVHLGWTNNSTDDNGYYVEDCFGLSCTNFIQIAQLGANATAYIVGFPVLGPGRTVRFRVRTHSPGGYSSYSNIWTKAVL